MTRPRTNSRASHQLDVFALHFDWITGLPVCFVIGQNNYFGFGLRHSAKSLPLTSKQSNRAFCLGHFLTRV